MNRRPPCHGARRGAALSRVTGRCPRSRSTYLGSPAVGMRPRTSPPRIRREAAQIAGASSTRRTPARTSRRMPPRPRRAGPGGPLRDRSGVVPRDHSGSTGDAERTTDRRPDPGQRRRSAAAAGGPETRASRSSSPGVTRTNNATWYASKSGGAEHAMKQALKSGGDNALNVYTTSGGAYLGWAYLPRSRTRRRPTSTASSSTGGPARRLDEYAGVYDEGDTLVHEAGHWLNLEHTFFGGATRTATSSPTRRPRSPPASGCPVGRDTCPAPGLDPIHNYMDYSDDAASPSSRRARPAHARRLAPLSGAVAPHARHGGPFGTARQPGDRSAESTGGGQTLAKRRGRGASRRRSAFRPSAK